jgi:hypothetical protein
VKFSHGPATVSVTKSTKVNVSLGRRRKQGERESEDLYETVHIPCCQKGCVIIVDQVNQGTINLSPKLKE